MLKIAINGFGRIGRLSFRELAGDDRFEVVAINDLTDPKMLAHLLKYDSVQGRFAGHTVESNEDSLIIDGKTIRVYKDPEPKNLPWGELGVDIVLECTGFFCSKDKSQAHLDAGAKRVLISAPAGSDLPTIVYGVNHQTLKADDLIVSGASCTTNCLAPMAKALNDYRELRTGFMTTIHAYTGDQNLIDGSHKDPLRARAAAMSMIPSTTGAAKAVGKVLPELNGKLDGVAIRVPTPNVSLVDLTFMPSNKTTIEEVNAAATKYARGELKGILDVYDDPCVSTDFNHDPHSSLFSLAGTKIVDGDFVRVMSWYDNEWGFSCRMIDTALEMHKKGY